MLLSIRNIWYVAIQVLITDYSAVRQITDNRPFRTAVHDDFVASPKCCRPMQYSYFVYHPWMKLQRLALTDLDIYLARWYGVRIRSVGIGKGLGRLKPYR